MKKFSRFCGYAGLVLILLAGLGYALAPMYKGFYVIPGALAIVALLIYMIFNLAGAKKFRRQPFHPLWSRFSPGRGPGAGYFDLRGRVDL